MTARRATTTALRVGTVATLLAVTGCGVQSGPDIIQGDRQAAIARDARARQDAATVAVRRAALPSRPAGVLSITTRVPNAMLNRAVTRLQQTQSPSTFDTQVATADGAFEELCAGQTDLIQSARRINATEQAQCDANGLDVSRPVVVGYATAVLVTRNGTDIGGDCLTLGGVKSLLRTGSSVTNWRQIGFGAHDFAVSAPVSASPVMQAIGSLALGFPIGGVQRANLRTDLRTSADQAEIGAFIAGEDQIQALNRATRAYEQRLVSQRTATDAAAIAKVERAAAQRVVAKIAVENRRRAAARETVADPAALERSNARRVSRAKQAAGARQRAINARIVARAGAAYRRDNMATAMATGRLGVVSYPYYEAHSDVLRPLEIDPRKRSAAGSTPECRFPSQQTIAAGNYPLALPIYIYGDRRTMRGPTARPLMREILDHNTELARQNDLAGLSSSALSAARRGLGLPNPVEPTDDEADSTGTATTPPPTSSGIPGVDAPQATP